MCPQMNIIMMVADVVVPERHWGGGGGGGGGLFINLILIPVWISIYIHYKVWDEITYPFPNVNSCTVEVC